MTWHQIRSLSHKRRLLADRWTPAEPTPGGALLPAHWHRSDGPLWQDAGITPAVSDGDNVGRWEDKASNADHVNQAAAANKPTLQNGAADLLNGHAVIRGDGVNDSLQGAWTTSGALSQPNTIFCVAKLDAAAVNDNTDRILFDGDDNLKRHLLYQRGAGTPDDWTILAGSSVLGGATDSNWNIWTVLFNGASSQLWQNGISEAGPGDAGAQAADGLTLFSGWGGGSNWDGDVAEYLIYNANLSDADKNQVNQYLARRYALTCSTI